MRKDIHISLKKPNQNKTNPTVLQVKCPISRLTVATKCAEEKLNKPQNIYNQIPTRLWNENETKLLMQSFFHNQDRFDLVSVGMYQW